MWSLIFVMRGEKYMSKKLTQEEFEKKFYMKYPIEFQIIGNYNNALTPVDVKCNQCGYIISHTPNHFDKGTTKCPVCNINGDTTRTIIGVNDMWTTNPKVAQLLFNPEDGYEYRFNTQTDLDFVCPCCGKHRMAHPNYFKNGYICTYCSDNIKYPNKLMANILDLCGIDFISEFHFKYSKYKYDFYIQLNNIDYLIEMDGGYGHGNIDTNYATKQEQIETDKIKDNLAIKNGYKIIRIDCNYYKVENRFNFISHNILQSELNNILPITANILNEADKVSQQNYLKKFVNYWNNGICSYTELSKLFHVGRSAIRDYGKRAIDCGMLHVSYNDFLQQIRKASNLKLAISKGTPVICEQTGEIFYSIAEAERKMNVSSLASYFHNNNKYCGKLSDGTCLTWKKISDDKYNQLEAV